MSPFVNVILHTTNLVDSLQKLIGVYSSILVHNLTTNIFVPEFPVYATTSWVIIMLR